MFDIFFFYIFLGLDTIAQNESMYEGGYICIAFILLDKMVLLKNIQTLWLQTLDEGPSLETLSFCLFFLKVVI